METKKKKISKVPKVVKKEKNIFRIPWECAAPFLIRGWQILSIETKGKVIIAVLKKK